MFFSMVNFFCSIFYKYFLKKKSFEVMNNIYKTTSRCSNIRWYLNYSYTTKIETNNNNNNNKTLLKDFLFKFRRNPYPFQQAFHLVKPSVWPFLVSMLLLFNAIALVLVFNMGSKEYFIPLFLDPVFIISYTIWPIVYYVLGFLNKTLLILICPIILFIKHLLFYVLTLYEFIAICFKIMSFYIIKLLINLFIYYKIFFKIVLNKLLIFPKLLVYQLTIISKNLYKDIFLIRYFYIIYFKYFNSPFTFYWKPFIILFYILLYLLFLSFFIINKLFVIILFIFYISFYYLVYIPFCIFIFLGLLNIVDFSVHFIRNPFIIFPVIANYLIYLFEYKKCLIEVSPIGIFYILFILLLLIIYMWFDTIINEAVYLGEHTKSVQQGIRYGFTLFIISEIFLFFSFFWAAWYLPGQELSSCDFVPKLEFWGLPLFNTIILVLSSITLHVVDQLYKLLRNETTSMTISGLLLKCKFNNNIKKFKDFYSLATLFLILTICLGLIFLICQIIEYHSAPFNINDGAYPTYFYMLTGLHGSHVFIGLCLLIISLIRHLKLHFTGLNFTGFKLAIWYWHFVDIVWLIVFGYIYVYKYYF